MRIFVCYLFVANAADDILNRMLARIGVKALHSLARCRSFSTAHRRPFIRIVLVRFIYLKIMSLRVSVYGRACVPCTCVFTEKATTTTTKKNEIKLLRKLRKLSANSIGPTAFFGRMLHSVHTISCELEFLWKLSPLFVCNWIWFVTMAFLWAGGIFIDVLPLTVPTHCERHEFRRFSVHKLFLLSVAGVSSLIHLVCFGLFVCCTTMETFLTFTAASDNPKCS